ncbi:MAG: UDP-N-acetylmuramoyl-L-alanine--D-glutamate ligase [Candidatus Omnitrophica bacterium]|nr:UDP-N-acetylmuramoyl-L-alanine--D-glutamate ligase [Candidatus Omnitrophota bacterium]
MRKVVVVGLGKSGIDSARLLSSDKNTVFITEFKNDKAVQDARDLLIAEGVVKSEDIELGGHTDKFIKTADLMVVSPGVRRDAEPIKLAEARKVPVISELELAYIMCHAPIIAVTGTSGKTTTTTLIGQMLRSGGFDAIMCGNIGNPFSGEIKKIKKDSVVVLEVSSFQLELIDRFKPKVSVILNISDNHLDRHKDMNEYITAKCRIFLNQDKNDVVFLNKNDELLSEIAGAIKNPKVEFFNEYKDFGRKYNILNEDFLAAMSAASIMGVDEAKMLEVLRNFKGIEHRLEHVANVGGIDFVNDSKATTISSVGWALKSLEENIVLIMGGRYKGGDFGLLKPLVEQKVDYIISIGEARLQIKNGLNGVKPIFEANSFSEAVSEGFKKAKKGGRVLLSPGCSSFDMFKSYEERGKIFKELVNEIRKSK